MSTTPQISVRALDANGDTIGGGGQANFLTDIDAVAQIIRTSLLLFQGEYCLDLTIGYPVFQQILGIGGVGQNPELVSMLTQQTIINSSDFVSSIQDIQTTYLSSKRLFTYNCTVNTPFGQIAVSFTPGASAIITPS